MKNRYLANLLAERNVRFKLWEHDKFSQPINSPYDMARAMGYEPSRITKTLCLQTVGNDRKEHYLVVIPADKRTDFKIIAGALGVSRGKLSMAPAADLDRLFNYPEIAIPLAISDIPVFMDSSLLQYETILVGAGVDDEEIEIAPADAVELSGAKVLPFATDGPAPRPEAQLPPAPKPDAGSKGTATSALNALVFPEEVQSAFGIRESFSM